jgi:K+-transporting ATPase ATPase A chain
VFSLLAISFSLPRVFGRMVGDLRQGYAIVAVMVILAVISVAAVNYFQLQAGGTVPEAVGAAAEGTEARFGISQSATFASATTLTSTGAVNSFHDSYTALGGMVPIVNMMLGEVAPGGVGSGLYGMLILAVITVFVAGLMVGRTPEYLGKKIQASEVKLVVDYILVMPALVLIGVAISTFVNSVSDVSIFNPGAHGFTELIYAFTSAANNNGSAFAGLTANTGYMNSALAIVMLFGRFFLIIPTLALAGALVRKRHVPASVGTFPTDTPLFVVLVIGVIFIVAALTFLPVLALGPIVEQLGL